MIVTAKSSIPTLWQWIVACTWGALRFKFMVMGAVFVFSLQKFIENPAAVTFILSLPTILSLVIGPVCRFLSDRIWTRFGRRKPFAVPSMVGIGLSLLLMPVAPNFWWLVAAYCLYHIANDFGAGPTEILKQEIIPPPQRGRASALASWIGNLASLAFYGLALGRFEDVGFFAGFPVSGEQAIYWGIAAMVFCVALFVMLGVKESPQDSPLRGQRLTFKTFVGGLSDRNLWPVYLLIVGWTVSGAGLGALTALLYSEQWGFTKQEMGINIAVGGVLNILFIALLGLFADRMPRMRTFKILLALSIAIEVAFFCYCEFVLHDKTPTLPEIILFGEITAVIGILLGMVYFPMVYDYIHSGKNHRRGDTQWGWTFRIVLLPPVPSPRWRHGADRISAHSERGRGPPMAGPIATEWRLGRGLAFQRRCDRSRPSLGIPAGECRVHRCKHASRHHRGAIESPPRESLRSGGNPSPGNGAEDSSR